MLEIIIELSVTFWYVLCGLGFGRLILTAKLNINVDMPIAIRVLAWPVLLVVCSLVKESE